jgi:hypothetical protein
MPKINGITGLLELQLTPLFLVEGKCYDMPG